MLNQDGRQMYELYLSAARDSEVEQSAHDNLERAIGVIGYALSVGHLSVSEHANEWIVIKLIREQRANARRAKEQAA